MTQIQLNCHLQLYALSYIPLISFYVTARARSNTVPTGALSPQLEAMVANCKVIVPQVPLDVLRKEILRTKVGHERL